MRPCPVCASPAEEDDIYCGVCGTNFETGTEEVAPVSTATTRAAVEAAQTLTAEGLPTRVVSMPCEEAFLRQTDDYRATVLPAAITARVAIEAGATGTWWRWAGSAGAVIGIDTFGVSAPAEDAYQHFDLTSDRVAKTLRALAN